jgi:hypothetical protein
VHVVPRNTAVHNHHVAGAEEFVSVTIVYDDGGRKVTLKGPATAEELEKVAEVSSIMSGCRASGMVCMAQCAGCRAECHH